MLVEEKEGEFLELLAQLQPEERAQVLEELRRLCNARQTQSKPEFDATEPLS